jgi:hypothetical protein
MASQVPALQQYRQIEPCTRDNCPGGFHLHQILGEKGYNTQVVHKKHLCRYGNQHKETGSAVYQLAHTSTKYPAQHEGIIIDELDLTKWLPEREISIARLSAAARLYATNSTADLLIRAIQATITDASQSKTPLHGQELFNAIDQRAGGLLYGWIQELRQDDQYMNTRPQWRELEEEEPAAQELEAANLAPIIFPHIMQALDSEVLKWKWHNGQRWNSCIRIGPGPHGWAFYITERRAFTPGSEGSLPSRAILDATADAEILSRLFGEKIELEQAEIDPPPGTRHLAIRTGKRYGKKSLCSNSEKNRQAGKLSTYLLRTIAEARYILRELDPEGEARTAHSIGLVSFLGCVDQIGEALDIPEHRRLHFWASRGSNQLADCRILLVIGTPCVNPDTIARLARALWANDPEPIDETPRRDAAGRITGYLDPRMQRVSDHLTRAELTQCAHRSRALRSAKTVVTFCLEEIDYLPATETITDLPQLTEDGRDAWIARREREQQKLDQARQMLEESGKSIHMLTVRELKAAAEVGTDAATAYLRQARAVAQQQTLDPTSLPTSSQEAYTHNTHTPVFSTPNQFVPEQSNNNLLENIGTKSAPDPLAVPNVEPKVVEMLPTRSPRPKLGQPCARCGHIDDWMWDGKGQIWLCSCYEWWYSHPEWRSGAPQSSAG